MMTHRERGLAAIRHQKTDRLALDYGATGNVTKNLCDRLGLGDNSEALLEFFGIDFRNGPYVGFKPWPKADAEGWIQDEWGIRHHYIPGTWDRDEMVHPFNEQSTLEQVEAHLWPEPWPIENVPALRQELAKLHEKYLVKVSPWCPFFHTLGWIMGQEDFLMALHSRPELIDAITGRIVDSCLKHIEIYLNTVGDLVDVVCFGNDFGTQLSTFISPEQWNRFIRPHLKRFYNLVHDHDKYVFQHSCGAIRSLIPALIEDGVDILDPIQVAANGMELSGLYDDFARRITLHGGIDTQLLLPNGTPSEVRAEVRKVDAMARASGGYILTGSQAFMEDIPVENLLALYDEVKKVAV